MSKLSQAIKLYVETNEIDISADMGLQTFRALYNMLGKEELYDGIAVAMEDNGHGDTYEDIIDFYENT